MKRPLRALGALATSAVLMALGAQTAFADQVTNDIAATPGTPSKVLPVVAGGSASVGFQILVAQSSGGATDPTNDIKGCNAGGNDAAVIVNFSVPSGMTAPTSPSFIECGIAQAVVFQVPASTTPGDYPISVASVTGGKPGSQFNTAPAAFSLRVTAPAPTDTTPPSITPTVVGTAGTNGWYTTDVTISWLVVDNESAVTSSSGCYAVTLITETAGQTFTCSATSAGGTTSKSVTVKLDKTGPSAALTVTGGDSGANGWYTSNVTVGTSGSDSISGPVTCTGDQTQTSETTGAVFNGSCTNAAGLSTNAAPLTVKLDKTGPSAALTVTGGTAGTNGWYTSDVTVSTSGSDSISGPVSCTGDQHQTAETNSQEFNGSCTNDAGLSTNAAPLTVKLDKTGPSAALAVTAGTPGANGWYTSDVTVSTSGSDNISGPVSCTADQTQSTETAGAVFNGSCTNAAGLTANADPLTVKLDKTGPSAALAVTGGDAGANGWYTSNVTVSTNGSDSISSPVTCTADQTQTSETAGAVFNGSCTNAAGLTTNADPLTVKLDKTAPGVSWTGGPAAGGAYYFGFVPSAPTCSATDLLSGPKDCSVSGYSTAIGSHALSATAHDNAGNTGTDTRSYSVNAWTVSGFYQPVDMGGVWNTVKNGSTVPLKFEVFAGTTELTDVAVVDKFTVKSVACPGATAPTDEIELTTTGGTSLRYDPTGGQFIQNWQTPKQPGGCYQVTMTTDDGTSTTANFKLK